MQLWKKNFLATFFMFLIVVYISLLILASYLFNSELQQWMQRALASERGILYLMVGISEGDDSRMAMNADYSIRGYRNSGIMLRVEKNGVMLANYISTEITADKTVQIVKHRGAKYILIKGHRKLDDGYLEVTYLESMEVIYKNQQRRIGIIIGLGALLSMIIGAMLYLTMKKIYLPVNQIAHELRTPLTGIQGYAQYLMIGNLTEEDRFFAAGQIVERSRNLGDIVEKLLLMGNVREGSVLMSRINLRQLLDELKKEHPEIEVISFTDYIEGDRTLVKCLLDNLIFNALHAGSNVKVTADSEKITVWNDGQPIDEAKLKIMNRNQVLAREQIDRHGYGISLCYEIVKVHKWKLRYESSAEEGTIAEISM